MNPLRSMLIGLTIAVPLTAVVAPTVYGDVKPRATKNTRLSQIQNFAVKGLPFVGRQYLKEVDTAGGEVRTAKLPVGTATSGIGVGTVIGTSYYDGSFIVPGRRIVASVDSSGYTYDVDVHILYRNVNDDLGNPPPSQLTYFWYNAGNGSTGSCTLPTAGFGTEGTIDIVHPVTSDLGHGHVSRVVIGGNEDDDLIAPIDPWAHLYWQSARFACPTDGGQLPSGGWAGGTSRSRYPAVAVQRSGADTIYHVIWSESEFLPPPPGSGYAGSETYHPLYYARKRCWPGGSTWSNGTTLDSIPNWSYRLAVTDLGSVAVSYTNTSNWGRVKDNPQDMDVYVRRSSDGGLTWMPKLNITNYQNGVPGDPNHFTAWAETDALFDHYGNLHVIWNAFPTSEDPYSDGYSWVDFSCNLYHWSSSDPSTITEIANADYGIEASSLACGFGGYNAGYIANFSISECESRLYVVFGQIHSKFFQFGGIDQPNITMSDCAYNGERFGRANWEIFLTVCHGLEGSCWDKPRNLSDTYTPDCGLSGDPFADRLCGNEYRPSMSKYGHNFSGHNPTWPPTSILDPSRPGSSYTGAGWIDLVYYDDEYPGSWFHGQGPATFNDLRWLHMACVEPRSEPSIAVAPAKIEWPEWVQCGTQSSFPITVTNDGDAELQVTQVNLTEFPDHPGSPTGWLSTTGSTFYIPGCDHSWTTFDVLVNANGFPTPEWLKGEIEIISNDPDRPSVVIPVNVLAACAVEPVKWDIVATSGGWGKALAAPGDNVALTCSNHGSLGHSGLGGVNMDFTVDGGECDPLAKVYLYDASPFVMLGADKLTTSHWTEGYEKAYVFKPQPWATAMQHGTTTEYDWVYLGQMVNRDSSIAIERTMYAPRTGSDNPSFIISKIDAYSLKDSPHSGFTLGSVADWDIPSEVQRENDAMLFPSQSTLAIRGTSASSCQDNSRRYGMEVFLGWYTDAEYAADPTVNHTDYYGALAIGIDPLLLPQELPDDPGPDPSAWWNEVAVPGLNIVETGTDLAVLTTFTHNVTLPATGKWTYYTAFISLRDAATAKAAAEKPEADINTIIQGVRDWYADNIRRSTCQGPLLHADFDQDLVNGHPDGTLPGDPVGDSLRYSGGAWVVDGLGTLTHKPLWINGATVVSFFPSSTEPRDLVKASCRFFYNSVQGGGFALYWGPGSQDYLLHLYIEDDGSIFLDNGQPTDLWAYPGVDQLFEVTLDFRTHTANLSVDGVPVAAVQSYPFNPNAEAVVKFVISANQSDGVVMDDIEICAPPITSCCVGRVGDTNGEGEYPDEVTLGDIMLLVDVKFISGDCSKLPCVAEADVNQDGGPEPTCDDHVTLGDIMTLVDFLFITGPENATLPECL